MNTTNKNQQWYIYAKKADFNQLAREHGITPVTARIMINRGIKPEEFSSFLTGTISDSRDALDMTDMDTAMSIIEDAIASQSRIRVVGDYDIDGVCSTTILTRAIKRMGGQVDFDIPDRVKDGYGINERIIDSAISDGVELIVTCDNGISAREVINKAVENGITVVVTDHHEVPELLPPADAVVDPKRPGDRYPFKEICGAVVAYKLAELLYKHNGIPEQELDELKEFAAIATVGDVMPLKDENRILVKQGLELIRNTKNTGLNALIDACQIHRDRISAYTIGFVLGPCINAGGRLETADIAMQLFAADDAKKAKELAENLKALNDTRKDLTERFVTIACQQVDVLYDEDNVLVIYLPECHESVAGIIAGRIKEYYHRPTIVLTDTGNEAGLVKGSARSIEAYDIFEKLTEVSYLLTKFGGHKLAAGMSLEKERIDEFREELNRRAGLTPQDMVEKLWIDVPMPFAYATAQQVRELDLLEPFGQGNERPVFAQKDVRILSARALESHRNIIKLRLKDSSGTVCDGILFADADETLNALAKRDKIDILYYPKLDAYAGREGVQIQIKAWK